MATFFLNWILNEFFWDKDEFEDGSIQDMMRFSIETNTCKSINAYETMWNEDGSLRVSWEDYEALTGWILIVFSELGFVKGLHSQVY